MAGGRICSSTAINATPPPMPKATVKAEAIEDRTNSTSAQPEESWSGRMASIIGQSITRLCLVVFNQIEASRQDRFAIRGCTMLPAIYSLDMPLVIEITSPRHAESDVIGSLRYSTRQLFGSFFSQSVYTSEALSAAGQRQILPKLAFLTALLCWQSGFQLEQ